VVERLLVVADSALRCSCNTSSRPLARQNGLPSRSPISGHGQSPFWSRSRQVERTPTVHLLVCCDRIRSRRQPENPWSVHATMADICPLQCPHVQLLQSGFFPSRMMRNAGKLRLVMTRNTLLAKNPARRSGARREMRINGSSCRTYIPAHALHVSDKFARASLTPRSVRLFPVST